MCLRRVHAAKYKTESAQNFPLAKQNHILWARQANNSKWRSVKQNLRRNHISLAWIVQLSTNTISNSSFLSGLSFSHVSSYSFVKIYFNKNHIYVNMLNGRFAMGQIQRVHYTPSDYFQFFLAQVWISLPNWIFLISSSRHMWTLSFNWSAAQSCYVRAEAGRVIIVVDVAKAQHNFHLLRSSPAPAWIWRNVEIDLTKQTAQ